MSADEVRRSRGPPMSYAQQPYEPVHRPALDPSKYSAEQAGMQCAARRSAHAQAPALSRLLLPRLCAAALLCLDPGLAFYVCAPELITRQNAALRLRRLERMTEGTFTPPNSRAVQVHNCII